MCSSSSISIMLPCLLQHWVCLESSSTPTERHLFHTSPSAPSYHISASQVARAESPELMPLQETSSWGKLSWLWRRNGLLFFCLSSIPTLVSPSSYPLCRFRTLLCVLIYADSFCTIMTHPRILVLGPGGCTMTHVLIPWLTLFAYICYRLCVLNYKYLGVAVVGP